MFSIREAHRWCPAPERPVDDAPIDATAVVDDDQAPLRLAPIPITPTKPLTPSHVKGLLWLDVLERATRLVRPVHYEVNRTTYDITWQTVEFWHWLEQSAQDVTDLDEVALGQRYVEFHLRRGGPAGPRPDELRRRVERGYLHPASRRVLEIWKRHYEFLGIRDPGLFCAAPLPLTADEVIALLASVDLVLDARGLGGAVYLDLTAHGVPLRTLVDADGRDNHLLCTLRQLARSSAAAGLTALLCDRELREDYGLLERCLRRLGAPAISMSLGRVRLSEAGVGSARHGGWEHYTVDRLAEQCRGFTAEEVKLGLRLYFIVGLGAGDQTVFRFDLLRRFLGKARHLLERPAHGSREAGLVQLAALVRHRGFVDPYRLSSLLLAPGPRDAMAPLLREIYT